MQYKGSSERPEVDTETFDIGDAFRLEVGDWNGTGFSHHNVDGSKEMLVIESNEDNLVVVSYEDRLEWNAAVEPDTDLEVTIHSDGSIEGLDVLDWNEAVKNIKRLPARGGEHMVTQGRQRTGRE